MDGRLLELLACPNCQGKLLYDQQEGRLVCLFDKSEYMVVNGVPIMLVEAAHQLQSKES